VPPYDIFFKLKLLFYLCVTKFNYVLPNLSPMNLDIRNMVLLELMLSFRKVLGNDINIDGWVTDPRTPQTNCSQCNKGKDIIAASSLIVRFQIVCLNKISCVPLDTSRLICCHC